MTPYKGGGEGKWNQDGDRQHGGCGQGSSQAPDLRHKVLRVRARGADSVRHQGGEK